MCGVHRRAAALLLALPLMATQAQPQDAVRVNLQGAGGTVAVAEFAPGIRIDWASARVELAAQVVLREGPLELLACSPRTREHESILVVTAQPQRIFEAMGLVGLQPGSPTRYDEARDAWTAATGEPLDLTIQCNGGAEKPVPAATWFRRRDSKAPPQEMRWVFAGSRRTEEGRFVADLSGTVACVVDFDSALIALDTAHTADDADLWLESNAAVIPPIGTRCTILVSSAVRRRIALQIVSDGGLRISGEEIGLRAAVERIASAPADRELSVHISVAAVVPQSRVDDVLDALRADKKRELEIVVQREPLSPDEPKVPKRRTEKR